MASSALHCQSMWETHSESAHGHCLGHFVFKCATHGILCSSAGGYQTALHDCGRPYWMGWIACVHSFVVRPHAPNREVRSVMVRYECMYHATPSSKRCFLNLENIHSERAWSHVCECKSKNLLLLCVCSKTIKIQRQFTPILMNGSKCNKQYGGIVPPSKWKSQSLIGKVIAWL